MAYAPLVATRLSIAAGEAWDVVVIGAGPAGCVAAAGCEDAGLRTLLVERQRFPRAKVCGGCLAPAGVRALKRLGLGAVLVGVGAAPLERARLVARGRSCDLPIGYVGVDRSRFDEALANEAAARGVTFLDGVAARVERDDAVSLAEEAEGREGGGRSVRVAPRVAIVADGLHGRALAGRDEFAWRVDHGSPVGVGAVLTRRPEHAAAGGITMVCGRGGYVGAAPMGAGSWALAAALRPAAVREAGPSGAIAAVLAESGFEMPPIERGGLRGVGNLTRRRRAGAGRVLAVGDAAGYVQPLTGEGMSWGIVAASRVVPFAVRAARGEDVSGGWSEDCAGLLRGRRRLCRAVCALAGRPGLMAAALAVADLTPGRGWVGRRVSWGGL